MNTYDADAILLALACVGLIGLGNLLLWHRTRTLSALARHVTPDELRTIRNMMTPEAELLPGIFLGLGLAGLGLLALIYWP